jgi:hypothetical protein
MLKDLSKISLMDLHIYKQNAFQTLAKLERLLGNNRLQTNTYEFKDFNKFGKIYKYLEEEMNQRIIEITGIPEE